MLPREVIQRPKTPLSADPNQVAFALEAAKVPRAAVARAIESDYIAGERLFAANGTLRSDQSLHSSSAAISFLAWLGQTNVRFVQGPQ